MRYGLIEAMLTKRYGFIVADVMFFLGQRHPTDFEKLDAVHIFIHLAQFFEVTLLKTT